MRNVFGRYLYARAFYRLCRAFVISIRNFIYCVFKAILIHDLSPIKEFVRPFYNCLISSELAFNFLIKKYDAKTTTREQSYLFKRIGFYEAGDLYELYKRALGLHKLLESDDRFSYSILIPVYRPQADFFKQALVSALLQTAPNLEVLIGFDGEQPDDVTDVINYVTNVVPRAKDIIRTFNINRQESGGGISNTTNYLAKQARNKYLVFMDHDDWIRPDLLYRYEQFLRMHGSKVDKVALYCDEFKIDQNNRYVGKNFLHKPLRSSFPYTFINYICHCLMVRKDDFFEAGALEQKYDGVQDYHLCLKLDTVGVKFHNVPFPMYAWRSHPQSTAMSTTNKKDISKFGVAALTEYVKKKNLEWDIVAGLTESSYRAIPKIKNGINNKVHVVIPFKNEKEKTLNAIESIQKQKGIIPLITLINNNSDDADLLDKLSKMDVEILNINEPFNYSRLNNTGALKSRYSKVTEHILFMNNDVVLDDGAAVEMFRWSTQPAIGMVGCMLLYPNKLIQHGGVDLLDASNGSMMWAHTGQFDSYNGRGFYSMIRITDAVTAACAMVKRSSFEKVGGFDELLYPIAFSDTNLALKLRKISCLTIYTPFASGVHYESITRGRNQIEDVEGSVWLNQELDIPYERASFYYND